MEDQVDRVLRSLGGNPLASDPAIYCFYSKGSLELILSTHVDDKKGGGTEAMKAYVRAGLEKAFGSLTVQESSFIHCGIMHEQTSDGIKMHQQHYVKQLNSMDTTGINPDKPEALNAVQQSAYLSLLGGLSWLVQTRMDIAVYVCYLQRNSKATTTEHYLKVNKLLRFVKRKPVWLFYGKLKGPFGV